MAKVLPLPGLWAEAARAALCPTPAGSLGMLCARGSPHLSPPALGTLGLHSPPGLGWVSQWQRSFGSYRFKRLESTAKQL